MLSVEGLRSRYGRIEVLHGVDLEVGSGEIVTVVGANGAGKTTLLRCISGVQPASGGAIIFRGEALKAIPAHRRVALGLSQSPEGRLIFTNLTVEENLRLGAYLFADERVERDMADAFAMFPILKEKRNLPAGGLSGGQQQMLAIGRALMGSPKVLLLDEPSLGLAPIVIEQVFGALQTLNRAGMTILLVEQNAKRALEVSNRAYVIERGRIVQQGASAAMRDDPVMMEHYLGAPLTQKTTMRREDSHV